MIANKTPTSKFKCSEYNKYDYKFTELQWKIKKGNSPNRSENQKLNTSSE